MELTNLTSSPLLTIISGRERALSSAASFALRTETAKENEEI